MVGGGQLIVTGKGNQWSLEKVNYTQSENVTVIIIAK